MQTSGKTRIFTVEILTIAGILISVGLIIIFYKILPERIPAHFSFSGKPNGYNGRESVWLLPLFSGIQYIMLSSITFFIGMLKRPDEITTEVLILVARMLRQLKLLFSLISLYLVIGTFLIASGKASGLGIVFTPLFLLLLAIVVIGNMIRIIGKQRTPKH